LGDSCKLNGRIGFRGYTEKDIVTKEIGGVLTFSPTNIVDNKLTMECKNTYITREKYDESPEIKIFNGDILFVKTGSTLGKSALVTGLKEDASINPQIVVMRVEKDKETFMSNVLITDGIKKQVTAVKIGGAVPTMTETELKNIKYYEPVEKEEQKRIGQYFEHLDHLITLHQRKCDETKQLKKFMLQKMFPKNGEKNPEIRFEGFTDAWEQRKLDTVAKFSKGSGYSKGDLIETGTPIILYGRLYTKYETSISDVDTYVEAKEGSVYSKGGEVIVPASGETAEDIARAATVDKSGILLGGDLNVVMPNEDINSAFLAISISNGNSQRELAKKAQGKSVVHIHNEEIRNLIVPFPIKAEQNRIVDYFSTLDHLITLHQRKCEKLKALKKFMLQNMFI
jgi:restriction endonuclease S subunit